MQQSFCSHQRHGPIGAELASLHCIVLVGFGVHQQVTVWRLATATADTRTFLLHTFHCRTVNNLKAPLSSFIKLSIVHTFVPAKSWKWYVYSRHSTKGQCQSYIYPSNLSPFPSAIIDERALKSMDLWSGACVPYRLFPSEILNMCAYYQLRILCDDKSCILRPKLETIISKCIKLRYQEYNKCHFKFKTTRPDT